MVDKFVEVFGKEDDDDDPTNDFTIPIIPNLGNNDILPHNIFTPGPNRWTRKYDKIWRRFIPEEQRHVFERGGYFFVEAIPNKLAIFSLNSLYFFDSNTAVDGCARKSEPGYEQMEWLRIQLELIRRRGMKAILTGHVPPARTENKMSWDDTCWHKYTYWMQQYRDVVVGGLYGHMNIDHFMLQDSRKVKDKIMNGEVQTLHKTEPNGEFSVQSSAEYLSDLRKGWRKLPDSDGIDLEWTAAGEDRRFRDTRKKKKKHKKSKEEKFFSKIGGEWGERYSLTFVGGSVVPNYFPSMRVFEYNITGLDALGPATDALPRLDGHFQDAEVDLEPDQQGIDTKKDELSLKKWKKKKPKKPHFRFTLPLPPSKSAPPGPAYSPQTLTLLGYTQYFANLTTINNDFHSSSSPFSANALNPLSSGNFLEPSQLPLKLRRQPDSGPDNERSIKVQKWHPGKHSGKVPHPKKVHRKFAFEVEYDTRSDEVFNLTDLTVRNYIGLASRLGRYKPSKHGYGNTMPVELKSRPDGIEAGDEMDGKINGFEARGKGGANVGKEGKHNNGKKSKKERKRAKRKELEELWFTFVRRAYIGSKDEEDLREDFGGR